MILNWNWTIASSTNATLNKPPLCFGSCNVLYYKSIDTDDRHRILLASCFDRSLWRLVGYLVICIMYRYVIMAQWWWCINVYTLCKWLISAYQLDVHKWRTSFVLSLVIAILNHPINVSVYTNDVTSHRSKIQNTFSQFSGIRGLIAGTSFLNMQRLQ